MDIDRMNNLTDNEVKHLIEKKSAGDDFATLPINVQKKIIKELKEYPSISLRQLDRLTGISFHTIRGL